MTRWTRGAAAVIGVAAVMSFAACGSSETSSDKDYPAVVEPIDGSEVSKITLTEKAVERLDLKTTPVTRTGGALTVPYAAVLYSPGGETWVYTSPEPLSYVRAPIDVASISGNRVTLAKGPAAGTEVVTTAVAELFGAESGLGQ